MNDAKLGLFVMGALYAAIPLVMIANATGIFDGPIRVEQARNAAIDRDLAPLVRQDARRDSAAIDMLVRAQKAGVYLSDADADYAWAVTHPPKWAGHQ